MPSRRTFLRAVGGVATVGGVGFALSGRRLPGTCPPRREPTWELSGRGWTTPEFGTGTLVLGEWFGMTGRGGPTRLVALEPWMDSGAAARNSSLYVSTRGGVERFSLDRD